MRDFFKAGPFLIVSTVCIGYLCYAPVVGALRTQDKAPPTLSVAQATRAKQLFKEKCSKCHGADGRGQTVLGNMLDPPNFTDQAWWKNVVDDKRLTESVRNGKGGMPKFGKKLTVQQIGLLVAYLRRFDKSAQ